MRTILVPILTSVVLAAPGFTADQPVGGGNDGPGTTSGSGIDSDSPRSSTDRTSGASTTQPAVDSGSGRVGGTSSGSAALDQSDRDFIAKAASGGMFEVKSSQLLAGMEVKDQKEQDFATMMIQDHSAANRELQQIAEKKGVQVASELLPDDQRMLDDLRSLEGDDLQKRYDEYQVDAHRDAIALFQREAQQSHDPDLRQFAEKTLPTLQLHAAHLESHENLLDNK